MLLYRAVHWGQLAQFHVPRHPPVPRPPTCEALADDKSIPDCPERTDPARSLPGSQQEKWIAEEFRRSQARWDVLGQQVFFSQVDFTPGAGRGFNPDAWDGYPGSRDRVVDSWTAAKARNLLVLTGDVHAHWAADIKQRFDDPAAPVVGSELVSSSITSGGDGSETSPTTADTLADNPHIRFYNNRRGYVRTRFDAERGDRRLPRGALCEAAGRPRRDPGDVRGGGPQARAEQGVNCVRIRVLQHSYPHTVVES